MQFNMQIGIQGKRICIGILGYLGRMLSNLNLSGDANVLSRTHLAPHSMIHRSMLIKPSGLVDGEPFGDGDGDGDGDGVFGRDLLAGVARTDAASTSSAKSTEIETLLNVVIIMANTMIVLYSLDMDFGYEL